MIRPQGFVIAGLDPAIYEDRAMQKRIMDCLVARLRRGPAMTRQVIDR